MSASRQLGGLLLPEGKLWSSAAMLLVAVAACACSSAVLLQLLSAWSPARSLGSSEAAAVCAWAALHHVGSLHARCPVFAFYSPLEEDDRHREREKVRLWSTLSTAAAGGPCC